MESCGTEGKVNTEVRKQSWGEPQAWSGKTQQMNASLAANRWASGEGQGLRQTLPVALRPGSPAFPPVLEFIF